MSIVVDILQDALARYRGLAEEADERAQRAHKLIESANKNLADSLAKVDEWAAQIKEIEDAIRHHGETPETRVSQDAVDYEADRSERRLGMALGFRSDERPSFDRITADIARSS